MEACLNNCGRQSTVKKGYNVSICSKCVKSLEGKISRSAIAKFKKYVRTELKIEGFDSV